MENLLHTTPFNTKKSIKNSNLGKRAISKGTLTANGNTYSWTTNRERVKIIRKGIPYVSLEVISKRLNSPLKSVLEFMGLPQTTYNKKKKSQSLLDNRDSEQVILISDLIDYGIEVFNGEEEKFQRWLKKSNLSLGQSLPFEFFDTVTGINEVRYCLNRIDYGNFA